MCPLCRNCFPANSDPIITHLRIVLEWGSLAAKGEFMKKVVGNKWLSASVMASVMMFMPVAALAQQTQIKAPKNKYKVQDDIKLGSQAAVEIERQFPILNDSSATDYVERIGQRLV